MAKQKSSKSIAKVVKWIAGEDCGCEERKKILNELFPYKKPDCLTESEYGFLKEHYTSGTNTITPRKQRKMVEIYNRVFNDNATTTSCSSCFLNGVHSKLLKVYEQYKESNG